MEFYRAAAAQLPYPHCISPDVGVTFGTSGKLDFWVDNDLCWAIELLREGLAMKEHAARFETGGEYEKILKASNRYVPALCLVVGLIYIPQACDN